MKIHKLLALLLSLISAGANAGFFDELNDGLNKAISDVNKTVAQSSGKDAPEDKVFGSALSGTALQDIFLDSPYDSSKRGDEQWPRVAFTVHEQPEFHSQVTPGVTGAAYTEGCWTLSAIIWHNETSSEQVEDIRWCTPENVLYEVAKSDASLWFIYSADISFDKTTGEIRTDGPLPPSRAFPSDMRHKRFFRRDISIDLYNGEMFAAMIYQIGLNWSDLSDRRVWITKFDDAYK